jgi:hypothetical protein
MSSDRRKRTAGVEKRDEKGRGKKVTRDVSPRRKPEILPKFA